ncbi:MAG: flavodoxin family protein [Planctomycetota bacterium]|nr:flavodoxin family protein [Planctomycetota bacterium]
MASRVLIVFDGKRNSTIERMAMVVATGARAEGLEAICETVDSAQPADLENYQGIILGSPCYFAGPSAKMKTFLDATWPLRGKFVGKVGAAFTASQHIGGGNELTLRALIDFFLIHGMIVQGDCEGEYFGAVALNPTGEPDEVISDESGECHRLGERTARLVKRLFG